jgi:hypothetical protein
VSSRPNSILVSLAFALSFAACACGSSTGSADSNADGGTTSGLSGDGNGGSAAPSAGTSGSGVAQGGAASSAVAGGGGSAGQNIGAAGAAGLSAGGASGGAGAGGSGGSAGTGGTSPATFPANCTCMNLGPPSCAGTGHVSYTLVKAAAPTADQQTAYDAITCAMQGAIAYYDCYTSITKQLSVTYNTDVPTADGNFNGSIRFGGSQYMECVTAMHEIAHTVGVGTAPAWPTYSVGGVFTGVNAIAQLRQITGNPTDVLHSDTQHFWPYGLNYTSEATSTMDLIDHCEMVSAIRKDLGLQ